MEDVITVKDVTKKFRIYYDKGSTLKEKILFKNRNHYEDRWVLKGINLNIKKGETVGLIGENGSGKSTLLKLLTKIIYPDSGTIEIKGKVSSLLELGAGFHPDMTGRENIYMNASIFGLTKREIDKRLDDIVSFSELEEFIDNPVRTYSSGMYMRLAFSVAINVDPDILIIDEILAVGDAMFQKKCIEKIQELKSQDKTIIIVSHDNNNVKKLCSRVLWLNNGKIFLEGNCDYVIDRYIEFLYQKKSDNELIRSLNKIGIEKVKKIDEKIKSTGYANEEEKSKTVTPKRWGTKEIEILSVKLLDINNDEKNTFRYGEKLIVRISYKSNADIIRPVFGFGIFLPDGQRCYGTNTNIDGVRIDKFVDGQRGYISLIINNLYLTDGIYYLNIAIHSESGYIYDYLNRLFKINIYSDKQDIGIFKPIHSWKYN